MRKNPTLRFAAARDQHSSRKVKDYVRNMLSRRQLQGFVRQRYRISFKLTSLLRFIKIQNVIWIGDMSYRACGYDPSDAAVGGHAPIRCRNATILPR
jgi:hypothetical protein